MKPKKDGQSIKEWLNDDAPALKELLRAAMTKKRVVTGEELLRADPEAWVIAVDDLQSGNPHTVAYLLRLRIPQPQWVADMLADWITGVTKLPPRKRGPALGIHPIDLVNLQARFTKLRWSGMSEALAIDTLHNETGIGVSTLRSKYLDSLTKKNAALANKIGKKNAAVALKSGKKIPRLRKKP